tara:strand:+ start:13235 stop:13552 length:318 start_codon:yes stop_codon:yes gene_type:complete
MSYLKSKPGSVEEAITAAVMQEKLSPKQQKLDKNNNGKIDGSDLAKLRAKKEDNHTDDTAKSVLPASQEPKDPMNIKSKDPEKKTTLNASKSDKIEVNPKIDYSN